jgi:hypothetical protein
MIKLFHITKLRCNNNLTCMRSSQCFTKSFGLFLFVIGQGQAVRFCSLYLQLSYKCESLPGTGFMYMIII